MGLLSDSNDKDISPLIRDLKSPFPHRIRRLGPRIEVVQFSSLPSPQECRRLASLLQDYPGVTLRAYGGYDKSIVDLEWLQYFPTQQRVQIDALYDLQDISGLGYLPADLTHFGLGQTRKRLSLAPLGRFRALRRLQLEGHTKNIEVVSELSEVVDLTLRSITLPDLSLLLPLRQLRALDIKLGGTKDLALLPELAPLRYLELWMVKGLDDISAVADTTSLEELSLQALKNVTALPDLRALTALKFVHLETMKGLIDLQPLADAPALKQLFLIDMPHLQPEAIRPLVGHPTLSAVGVGMGSTRKNDVVMELLRLPRARWDSLRQGLAP